jgi:hypothetical protein
MRVSPLRDTKRFHVKGKLSPMYVGPYPIMKRVVKVAYKLELPPELAGVQPSLPCVSTPKVCGC